MEYASIEREIHIDASPEVVFEVVSRPEHIREWWSVDVDTEPVPGAVGELVWNGGEHREPMKVVTVEPPRVFSFRWVYVGGHADDAAASLLVTFELVPSGEGTLLRVTETGFREMGWEAAVLEQAYQDHCEGWDLYVPRIGEHAAKQPSPR